MGAQQPEAIRVGGADSIAAQLFEIFRAHQHLLASHIVGLHASVALQRQIRAHRRVDHHGRGVPFLRQPGGIKTAQRAAHQQHGFVDTLHQRRLGGVDGGVGLHRQGGRQKLAQGALRRQMVSQRLRFDGGRTGQKTVQIDNVRNHAGQALPTPVAHLCCPLWPGRVADVGANR